MTSKDLGLIEKYRVERTDGKPVNWCFVLEDKDPLAWAALLVYADMAEGAGYLPLAVDLRAKVAGFGKPSPAAPAQAAREKPLAYARSVRGCQQHIVMESYNAERRDFSLLALCGLEPKQGWTWQYTGHGTGAYTLREPQDSYPVCKACEIARARSETRPRSNLMPKASNQALIEGVLREHVEQDGECPICIVGTDADDHSLVFSTYPCILVQLAQALDQATKQRDVLIGLIVGPLDPNSYWISCRVCHMACVHRSDGGPVPDKPGYGHADWCPVPAALAMGKEVVAHDHAE